jgi:hypothetical protein
VGAGSNLLVIDSPFFSTLPSLKNDVNLANIVAMKHPPKKENRGVKF